MSFQLLHLQHPIIQAPMAGVTTPDFVAAASRWGALGSIGAGYLSAEDTRAFIRDVKERTAAPFAVNLFVPEENEADQECLRTAYLALQPIGEKLGMPFWKAPISQPSYEQQLKVVIEERVPVCSFTFGVPDEEDAGRLKNAGVYLIGTATSVEEAVYAEHAGMDAVVLQGREAGGHRGSFLGTGLLPVRELIAEAKPAVSIPLIAAGGIADKEGMQEVLALGAEAVQIGTALLAADESGAHPVYKNAVLEAGQDSTVLTKAFSGKMARGIRNEFIDRMEGMPAAPYPYQNDLTKRIRSEAAKQGRREYMSLWAGENVYRAKGGTVQEILGRFL